MKRESPLSVTILTPSSPHSASSILHLFAEGRHEAIYDKLGAHVRKIGKVSGVSFAVWAPHAEGVSVVGSFNRWRASTHQMRMLGGSGVWEIFVPELEPGVLYKYEIRTGAYPAFLKADPYAFYMEEPPDTSSIVYQPNHKFRDRKWLTRARDSGTLSTSAFDLRSPLWFVATRARGGQSAIAVSRDGAAFGGLRSRDGFFSR